MGTGCWDGEVSQPVSESLLRSICVEESDVILPRVTQQEIIALNRMLIVPHEFQASPDTSFDFLAKGLEVSGWTILDADSIAQTDDPTVDIENVNGVKPDVVVFYMLRKELLDKWTKLRQAPFLKVLITGDMRLERDIISTQRFMEFGDAVFAEYPEAFTTTVHPKRILCHPFYYPRRAQIEQLNSSTARIFKALKGDPLISFALQGMANPFHTPVPVGKSHQELQASHNS